MLPIIGEKIRVFDLPSYRSECKPTLPVEVEVSRVDEYPFIVVCIDGNEYELYEDDGYETINT